jgi:Fe-S-cluster-containing hydrogenase component 2
MLPIDGIPTKEDILAKAPPVDRMKKGAVAMIECWQEIPCNPCVVSCPTGAITMESLTAIPQIDFDKCIGCALCVAACPGLAILLVDSSKEDGDRVSIPYEFPLPEVGETVDCLNHEGKVICEGVIEKVVHLPAVNKKDKTPIVTIKVPKGYALQVRFFKRR